MSRLDADIQVKFKYTPDFVGPVNEYLPGSFVIQSISSQSAKTLLVTPKLNLNEEFTPEDKIIIETEINWAKEQYFYRNQY